MKYDLNSGVYILVVVIFWHRVIPSEDIPIHSYSNQMKRFVLLVHEHRHIRVLIRVFFLVRWKCPYDKPVNVLFSAFLYHDNINYHLINVSANVTPFANGVVRVRSNPKIKNMREVTSS